MALSSNSGQQLKKAIGAGQFFSLSFSAIVGVGWIVVLGDWLRQGGPLGTMLAFVLASSRASDWCADVRVILLRYKLGYTLASFLRQGPKLEGQNKVQIRIPLYQRHV